MRGAQCAGQAPGTPTDSNYTGSEEKKEYPTTWYQWSNFIGEGDNATTICSSEGLTAQSQIDFVTFITNTFNEGEINVGNMSKFLGSPEAEKQISRRKGTAPPASGAPLYVTPNMKDATIDQQTGDTITKNSVIYHQHYNALTSPLNGNDYNAVSKDSLNKTSITNIPSSGKVAGFGGEQSSKAKGDQILAADYVDLAKKAKSLLYHPYQCNLCNICEGSEWLEVVKATWEALRTQGEGKLIYFTHEGSQGYINLQVNGESCHTRLDCSGTVGAAIYFYAKAQGVS